MTSRAVRALAMLSGVVAALATLAAAEIATLVLGGGSPLLGVGSFLVDAAPAGAKTVMVGLFGTGDKNALAVFVGVVVLVLAALAGWLEYRRSPFGAVLLAAIGVFGLIAVITRADAGSLSGVPTIVGAIVGVIVLRVLARLLRAWSAPLGRTESKVADPRAFERRNFLRATIIVGAVSVVAGLGARALDAGAQATRAIRDKIALPAPASTVPPIPAAGELDVAGISPYITPNADFYRIDTALQVPSIDPEKWELKIIGMVEEEVTISYKELSSLPLGEHIVTLTCVSNEVGGDLIGNAKWLGYPIRDFLAKAKPKAGADMVLSRSIDGFTASTPLSALQDEDRDAIFAIGMNGEPLPLEHGFPVRMVVPGLYGYVSATKWVVELKVTTFAKDQGYWTPRGWSAMGPIKLSSRIDTPLDGRTVSEGTVPVAGVAWAQHTGISKVEVSVDGGSWAATDLAQVVTIDSWLQWSYPWKATKGRHKIRVRATDAAGALQIEKEQDPDPDGSTGYHEIDVTVA